MSETKKQINILMAEDDPDDRLLVEKSLRSSRLLNRLFFVEDGEELMDYLHHRGKFRNPETAPFPGLILLDLNMPKKDGREALVEIKSHEKLRRIPIVVLTTSKTEEDILRSYDIGANSYITKPVTFNDLCQILRTLGQYWLEIVELPA